MSKEEKSYAEQWQESERKLRYYKKLFNICMVTLILSLGVQMFVLVMRLLGY